MARFLMQFHRKMQLVHYQLLGPERSRLFDRSLNQLQTVAFHQVVMGATADGPGTNNATPWKEASLANPCDKQAAIQAILQGRDNLDIVK
jgi:hypothetical protein